MIIVLFHLIWFCDQCSDVSFIQDISTGLFISVENLVTLCRLSNDDKCELWQVLFLISETQATADKISARNFIITHTSLSLLAYTLSNSSGLLKTMLRINWFCCSSCSIIFFISINWILLPVHLHDFFITGLRKRNCINYFHNIFFLL